MAAKRTSPEENERRLQAYHTSQTDAEAASKCGIGARGYAQWRERQGLPPHNPHRPYGIGEKPNTPEFRKAYREAIKARGLCLNCNADRGDDGTKTLCRPCSNKTNARNAEKRRAARKNGLCQSCFKEDAKGKTLCPTCAEYHSRKKKQYYAQDKLQVLDKYGKICVCCGEDEIHFLEVDHIQNDGGQERREKGFIGSNWYRHLLKIPVDEERYRILCANCNRGRWRNGGLCPHLEVELDGYD